MNRNIKGETFVIGEETYSLSGEISVERKNGDIYLCEDTKGNKYVAKYFCNGKPMPVVGYGKYNHYGRRREGSQHVFNEIQSKSKLHDFLIDYHSRIKFKGNWLILIQYIEGVTLDDFFSEERPYEQVMAAVRALAETLAWWHKNGFAHGDPHLGNAILNTEGKVVLIDYGQIHHKDFSHCHKYCCINSNGVLIRKQQDLDNTDRRLGAGFRAGLARNDKDAEKALVQQFDTYYNEYLLL